MPMRGQSGDVVVGVELRRQHVPGPNEREIIAEQGKQAALLIKSLATALMTASEVFIGEGIQHPLAVGMVQRLVIAADGVESAALCLGLTETVAILKKQAGIRERFRDGDE